MIAGLSLLFEVDVEQSGILCEVMVIFFNFVPKNSQVLASTRDNYSTAKRYFIVNHGLKLVTT